jgi:hypothetical protein
MCFGTPAESVTEKAFLGNIEAKCAPNSIKRKNAYYIKSCLRDKIFGYQVVIFPVPYCAYSAHNPMNRRCWRIGRRKREKDRMRDRFRPSLLLHILAFLSLLSLFYRAVLFFK